MVVDDDRYVRAIIRNCFEGMAQAIEHKTGEETIKSYQENVPALVLMDIHMP